MFLIEKGFLGLGENILCPYGANQSNTFAPEIHAFHHFQNPTVSDFDRRVSSFHSCSGCLFTTSIFGVVRLSFPLESAQFADFPSPYAFAHSQDAFARSQ